MSQQQAIVLKPAVYQSLSLWTAADVAHVKEMIAPQANEQEYRLLLYMANLYKLDPLVKQIWCVKYGSKPAQIFAGRDGFLAIAHRSGAFDGLDTTIRIEQVPICIEYTYWDNGQKLAGQLERAFQYVATARAYNKTAAHPVVVEVWEEEYSTGRDLWAVKPRTMLTKVAECQAVRKAFNISGLYEPSEMGHEDAIEGVAVEVPESTPGDRVRATESRSGVVGVTSSPQPAPAPNVASAGTQEANGKTLPTEEDYRKRIREMIKPLGNSSEQADLLNQLMDGQPGHRTVTEVLQGLGLADLKQLGLQIKGLNLKTPDDLHAWLDRQAADALDMADVA